MDRNMKILLAIVLDALLMLILEPSMSLPVALLSSALFTVILMFVFKVLDGRGEAF